MLEPSQGSAQRFAVATIQQAGLASLQQPTVAASAKSLLYAESLRVNIPPLFEYRQQQSAETRRLWALRKSQVLVSAN